jgi:hypothetical protein
VRRAVERPACGEEANQAQAQRDMHECDSVSRALSGARPQRLRLGALAHAYGVKV